MRVIHCPPLPGNAIPVATRGACMNKRGAPLHVVQRPPPPEHLCQMGMSSFAAQGQILQPSLLAQRLASSQYCVGALSPLPMPITCCHIGRGRDSHKRGRRAVGHGHGHSLVTLYSLPGHHSRARPVCRPPLCRHFFGEHGDRIGPYLASRKVCGHCWARVVAFLTPACVAP